MTMARRHPALACALITLVAGLSVLLATHRDERLAVPRARAVADLRANELARPVLARLHITRIAALPLDHGHDQLVIYSGLRTVATAVVSRRGTVAALNDVRKSTRLGSDIANDPRLLALLAAVFVLMSAVWPLWRLHNLDVLAATSLAGSVVFMNHSLSAPMVLTSAPALAYLAGRCGWLALGSSSAPRPATPMFEQLTAEWGLARQRRMLTLLAVALALIVAMVSLSSLHVVDVAYAVMEGATGLLHGVLPYGHIPDVIHGDTYPIASYLLYVPMAWLSPVHNVWDNADLTLVVAVAAALGAAWALQRRTGPSDDPIAEQRHIAGLRGAIAWLSFPALLVTVSTGTTDVVLGALIAGALLSWRRPTASTVLLACGAWFKLVPFVLLPLRLATLRGRALVRALLAALAVSAPMLAVLLALGGSQGIAHMVRAMAFQHTRGSPYSLWALIGAFPFQVVVQALALALVVAAAVRMRTDAELAADPRRVAALWTAVLLTLQLAANYWTFMYLSWIAPLLAVALVSGEGAPAGVRLRRLAQDSPLQGRSLREEPIAALTDAHASPHHA